MLKHNVKHMMNYEKVTKKKVIFHMHLMIYNIYIYI